MFDTYAEMLHRTSKSKGFYDSLDMTEFNSQAKQLMMVTSEVVEVMEALRKEKGEEAVLDELSDVFIRLMDFYWAIKQAGVITGDFESALLKKMKVNDGRPKMHGVLG